jgi:hypothetical protein
VNLEGAACATEDPDIFFPAKISRETLQRAQRICVSCPVIVQCGLYAEKTHVSDGVWGGQLRQPWHMRQYQTGKTA